MHGSSFFKFVDGIFGMQKHRPLIGLRQVKDVDAVCADLTAEFGALSGGQWLRPSRRRN
jgi:hypothetical protein